MKKSLANDFTSGLSNWLKATLEYAISTSVRSTGLKHAMRDLPFESARSPRGEHSITDVHGNKCIAWVTYTCTF